MRRIWIALLPFPLAEAKIVGSCRGVEEVEAKRILLVGGYIGALAQLHDILRASRNIEMESV